MKINMRAPSGDGGGKKAATGANPAKQPNVSNSPAKGNAKGMSSPSSKGGSKIKMSTSVGHGMTWKNSKGC